MVEKRFRFHDGGEKGGLPALGSFLRCDLEDCVSIEGLRSLSDSVVTIKMHGKIFERHRNPDGSVGGFVEEGAAVSPRAFLGKDAVVLEHAQVLDRSSVTGRSTISGNAKVLSMSRVRGGVEVSDNAVIDDNALVDNHVKVSGNAFVGGNARLFDYVTVSGDARIVGNSTLLGAIEVLGAEILNNAVIVPSAFYDD